MDSMDKAVCGVVSILFLTIVVMLLYSADKNRIELKMVQAGATPEQVVIWSSGGSERAMAIILSQRERK